MRTVPPATAKGSSPTADVFQVLDSRVHARLAEASMGLSPISLALSHIDWALHLATSPGKQWVLTQKAFELGWQAWASTLEPAAEASQPAQADARFGDEAWAQWPFNALREGFKATDAWWHEATHVDGMSGHHAQMVDFFARQGVDALSPSNWLLTNPTVLKSAMASGGETLFKGYQRYMEDLREQQQRKLSGPAGLKPLHFEVGKDVATTPGKVVFRNRLIELIQYTPTTDVVRPEPLLIVPSCIMKFYILDLSAHNSMVRFLVAQGFTVFMISWRNPDESDRDLGMQDYLQLGVMDAMAAVKASTAAPRIHALGYCLGGTFLAIVAAALAARDHAASAVEPRRRRADAAHSAELPQLATVALLAAQTDFSEPGELGVFIDDDQLQTLRASMAKTGYMSGKAMAGSFQFLNSRDLVWSSTVRRYLLGQDELGNDMMSWNADVTRLTERMHNEYLSSLFLNNALASGHYRVAGESVALMDIQSPMLVVGTVRDHVSPWRSVYKIHLLTDTHTTFVLAAGGHNAGIVSEPGHAGRSYQISSEERGHGWTGPDDWLAQVPVHAGSWWEPMSRWLQANSSEPVAAPVMDDSRVLCDAPGVYVKVRYAD